MKSKGKYNIHCKLEIVNANELPYANHNGDNVLLVHFNGGEKNGGYTWMPTHDEVQVIKDTLYYMDFTKSRLHRHFIWDKKKNKNYEIGNDKGYKKGIL